MKKDRRWLKSVIAASQAAQTALPWARAARRKPAAFTSAPAQPRALAAR